ncbi:MAG: L-threonylcarbamoyladenylate synthase [Desulfobacteraceae bacterium Eth-SRB1]|nr:MAG: L-threonylcarbamoyladenylate synthase [Desulfobacteraceae bacterium Eth-SRB1]
MIYRNTFTTEHTEITEKIRKIDPVNPLPDIIREAADVIKKGGIVLFPTRCLYGLGADAFNADAVSRVFKIKQRPVNKPMSVLVKDRKAVEKLVQYVPPCALQIMDSFWPGKVTIIFEAKAALPVNLTAGTGKIGIRIPEHTVPSALANMLDSPITGTSANLSGSPGCSVVSDLEPLIADKLDLILDAGRLKGGAGSTVIDVTGSAPKILREGAVPAKDIFAVLS